ncbi:hypothetical protein PG630_01150 [Riemerella anatipestifer]|nr:hypothetical protein [Riemerella anatipestifer]
MTAQQLYKKGIQWFEPTADNYMPLKATASDIRKTDKMNHFTWDEIAEFAEKDRFMFDYRSGGAGDWKAEGKPGNGFLLSEVNGTPYWTDALGQIPFAVDKFTDELESTGSVEKARLRTIEVGKQFGDGIGIRSDNSNGYDNAMIKRAINWAAKRYKVGIKKGLFFDTYILKKTDYSSNNLSKPSNEK